MVKAKMITVVVKSSSTPCTLEKRYSADSQYPLPSTFDDGTDRPGADETVSLHFRQNGENRETVEIFVKYIATRLVIRRVGRYLAFSARLPEEVYEMSRTFDSDDDDDDGGGDGDGENASPELCTVGCPASEQLDIAAAHDYVMGREQALAECNSTEHLSDELHNRLTDSYLDWCMFDLMTSGTVYDFVAVAHAAQADALDVEAHSLMNRTKPIDLISAQRNAQTETGASAAVAHLLRRLQLPVFVTCLVSSLSRYLL
ncbi:hypothetical protein V9T40_012769 [Parthenolecanium corni]|uniref:Repulsive guidance molecule C-terminal domain-containing protein n=1 Tax=Parthenolecanium corni TaxID=536013 RepID=A0AAN9Y0W0_9HEMI